MPRIDRSTGRRLSGAAQRRLAAHPDATAEAPAPAPTGLRTVPAPPRDRGVLACEAWVQSVNLVAVQAAAAGADSERVRLVRACVRKIGQLRDKARRSEKATELRRLRLGGAADLTSEVPPVGDPIQACAWAFLRLCAVLHTICTDADLEPKVCRDLVETIAASGFVPCKGEIDALTQRLRSAPQ